MLKKRVNILVLLGLLIVVLILGLLTGCRLLQPMDGPDMEYHGEETEPAEDSKPDTPETENVTAQETDKAATEKGEDANGSGAETSPLDKDTSLEGEGLRYLTVERTETPCGIIEMPMLDLEKLPGNDARLANQMFRAIRDRLVLLAEECQKEAAGGEPLEIDEPVCETRVCLSDDILSVLIRYREPDYYAPSMTLHQAVSLNVKTGEVVSPIELLKLAGYDTEEASAILRSYAEDCMTAQWLAMASCSGDDACAMPDDWGDPDLGWQNVLDEMIGQVWMEPQPLGESWDALKRSPAMFYEGGDRLSVCAPIPTLAGAGFAETMVNLGHDSDAIHDRNPLDCFGEPFGSRSTAAE